MDSHEPQSQPRQQQSPPCSQPPHLQPAVVLFGLNLFVNNSVPTTMMTPVTARYPPFNTNNIPSPHSESFNKDATVAAPSTTVQPCMKTVVEGSSSAFVSVSGANKRKRCRPSKHLPPQANDDHHLGSGEAQADPASTAAGLANPASTPYSSIAMKTTERGRPRGSSKHGRAETCFFTQIDVNPGENIIAKLTSAFPGGREYKSFVLSANGSVSTVFLHRPGSIATYKGHFQLRFLSCSSKVFESRKGFERMIDWTVYLLGGPDSRNFGGLVADKLIAASSVTVIMASFIVEDVNASSNEWELEPSTPSSQFAASATPANAIVQEPASDHSPVKTMRTFL